MTATPDASARPRPALNWHDSHIEQRALGERAADRMRNIMGSWPFVGGFVLFMLLWTFANAGANGWDPYPFILLNLFLSMMAGLQGAILLIAAKRQDAISAANTNLAAKADIEALLEINRRQLVVIEELRKILAD